MASPLVGPCSEPELRRPEIDDQTIGHHSGGDHRGILGSQFALDASRLVAGAPS